MSKLGILLICIISHTCSRGDLVQVSGKNAACFNDSAVFLCTDYRNGFLTWELTPIFGSNIIRSINHYAHPEGTKVREQIGPSTLVINVISADNSFINSTLTILNPISLNGTRIQCNRDFLWLTIILHLTFNPTQLILISNEDSNGIFNFTITLLPDSHDTEYFITVSPSLPYGPDEMTTASSTIISLEKTTQYNITILSSTCTERNNRTFVFGRCPVIAELLSSSVVQYIIETSGVYSAHIQCNTNYVNETHEIECGMNGQWNRDIADVCMSMNIIQSQTENDIVFLTDNTSINKSFTVEVEEGKLLTQVSIPVIVITISVIGSSILTLIIGIILGLLCGIKYMQKFLISKQSISTPQENVMRSMNGPIYEEVKLENKAATIDLSQNIAYEHAKALS